jgi:hypothetical protein
MVQKRKNMPENDIDLSILTDAETPTHIEMPENIDLGTLLEPADEPADIEPQSYIRPF